MATAETRLALLTQALTAATDQYEENARILGLIDDKAQKTAGIAGIFLAAAFAFLRRESIGDLRTAGGLTGMLLFAAALALFLACLVVSGLVVWARTLKLPPDPNKILAVSDLLLAGGGPSDDARENHVRDQAKSWNRASQTQDNIIADKSQKLLVAQWLLLCGIIASAGLLALLVFSSGPVAPERRIQLTPAYKETIHGQMSSMPQRSRARQQSMQAAPAGREERSAIRTAGRD